MVNLIPEILFPLDLWNGIIVWTEHLPNDWVPIIIERLWSWSAPATISAADADPPLIKTTIGLPLV